MDPFGSQTDLCRISSSLYGMLVLITREILGKETRLLRKEFGSKAVCMRPQRQQKDGIRYPGQDMRQFYAGESCLILCSLG